MFLHGLWRSGSTYVWSRFRVAEGTYCFYEPLHDGLRRLTPARIGRGTPEAVIANRHPALAEPYFAEFEPLITRRGVQGYRRRFAYDRFAPPVDADDPALSAYVQGLIDHAQGRSRAPVFGFNRTGLRVAWLRRRFASFNIHIDRDPVDIFASYLGQLQAGNYYYFVKWMQILAGNADYPLFQRAVTRFRRPNALQRLVSRPPVFYRTSIQEASLETLYSITFLAWAVCVLHAMAHSDLIIDIALAEQQGYTDSLTQRVRTDSGLDVEFHDMHAPSPPSPLSLAHRRAIEREVLSDMADLAAEGTIDRASVRERLGELSPRRADLLARLL